MSRDITSQKGSKPLTSTALVVVLAILCCALWGSAVPGVRAGYKIMGITKGDTGSQLMFAGIRFFLAGLTIVLGYSLITKSWHKPNKLELKSAFKLSLFQTTIQYVFYYSGLAHATGVNASIMQGISVFVAVIMSCLVFKLERMTRNKIIGCVLGFAGMYAASGAGVINSGFTFNGEGFLLIAAISGATAMIFIRKFSQFMSPIMLAGMQFAMGGLTLTLLGALLGGSFHMHSPAQFGIMCWLIIVSCVSYAIWNTLLRDNDVSRIMIYKFTTPIFGVIFSLMVLGSEGANLGIHTALGLILICTGIIVVQHKKAPAQTEDPKAANKTNPQASLKA